MAKKKTNQLKMTKEQVEKYFEQLLSTGKLPDVSEIREPATNITTPGKTSRLIWTTAMVEHLLELRLVKFSASLAGSKAKAQVATTWSKIVSLFNLDYSGSPINVTQLKAKYQSLKSEYTSLRQHEKQTGNGMLLI
jgi:hypothetical protein